jgi:predicted phage tail protein
VQDVIVTVIYRDNERDGAFPKNDSVDISLKDAQEENSFRETIDASQFVTERNQAILLGKFLCQTRRHSRRAIEFKTFPTDSFVAPGSFIYVEFSQNQWRDIYSGTIDSNGALNLAFGQSVPTGTYQVLLYNPSSPENKTLYRNNEQVVDGVAAGLTKYKGHVFALGTAVKTKRVFKVTEVSMDEEGEVTIKGVEHEVDENGLSLISHGLTDFVPGLFLIDGQDETNTPS